jgi:hypothetical protein
MPSEYDPLFSPSPDSDDDDLEVVRERFAAAGKPFRSSPLPWLAWAAILPAAALATPPVAAAGGPAGVMGLWSGAILAGGAVEIGSYWRRRAAGSTPLAAWTLRAQGNLSLVAVALSALLVWLDQAWALPALWLLLLGHNLWALGGLSFEPLRRCGLLYQLGGIAALWPHGRGLEVFAVTAAVANLGMAWAVGRRGRGSARG